LQAVTCRVTPDWVLPLSLSVDVCMYVCIHMYAKLPNHTSRFYFPEEDWVTPRVNPQLQLPREPR